MIHQLGQQGHKRISNKLPIIGISAVVIILIGLISMSSAKHRYKISSDEMLKEVLLKEYVIRPQKFMDIYYNNDTLYRFIDLRSSPDFLEGHIKGAIHIPLHEILADEYTEIFNQDEKINVLYYSDHCGACGPWMIIKQLGYKNIKVLIGGFNYVKPNIMDEYSPMTGNFSDEKAKYNYVKIINETSGAADIKDDLKNDTPPDIKIIKKEETKEEEGGC